MSAHLGEMAALATAACWTVTAIAFARAGERVGSMPVNLIRLALAIGVLGGVRVASGGPIVPSDATPHAWAWLSLSGIVGFTLGDLCLFRAFVVLGPRLSTLVMALAPPMTAALGWAVLDEHMGPRALLGMVLTLFGVVWAVRARAAPELGTAPARLSGVLLGLGGALGQAGGLVLSKIGMGTMSAVGATQIRVIAGAAGFVVVMTLARAWPRVGAALRDGRGMSWIVLGTLFGPVIGVALSLVAVRATHAGVAASLMAVTPILILPIAKARGEHIGTAGAVGASIAVAGVALLFS